MTSATMNKIETNYTKQEKNTLFSKIQDKIRLHFKRNRMLKELYDLDDRSLEDIGINRSEIYHFVKTNCK